MENVTVDALRNVHCFSELNDEHLQWIIDHSEYHVYEDGVQIRKTGDPAEYMIIMLTGGVDFYLEQNGRLTFYLHFGNDANTGGISGLLPYSRMKAYQGCAFAVGELHSLQLHKDHFSALEQLSPQLIQRMIGYMTERAKLVATTQLQHEKVNALGQLAAGIAHELNNPAAAISSIARSLHDRLQKNFSLTEQLMRHQLDPALIEQARVLAESKTAGVQVKLSALQKMQQEEALLDWLDDRQVSNSQLLVETFTDEGIVSGDLSALYQSELTAGAFDALLMWLENLLSSQRIVHDLAGASSRISYLVGSIKSHVHMDRSYDLQPTNLHQDIEDTVTLLGYKLREKQLKITRQFVGQLPEIPAYIGELNQVWTNLLDNAIFASPVGGEITITTSFDDKCVKVTLTDNGGGIPKEILSRIFDPFFTTKKVGEGTGIGLDMVNRILKHHQADIAVDSVPGRTSFTVRLPRFSPK